MRMHRSILPLLLLFVSLTACKDPIDLFDFPPYQTDKKVLLVNLTAVWSEYAGESGIPLFTATVQDSFPGRVVPITAHASTIADPFYTLPASQFYDLYDAELYPSLGLNAEGFQFRTEEWQLAIQSSLQTLVGGNLVDVAPLAVLAISKRIVDDFLQVKCRVKFLTAMQDVDLNLGLYITENNVIGPQEGLSLSWQHQYVLRGAATSGAWGLTLPGRNFSVNQVVELEGSFPINPSMNGNNLFANAVLFEMENGVPKDVINCNLR